MKNMKKKYKSGGFMPTPGLTNSTEVGAGASNMLVDLFDKPNKFGRQSGLGDGLKKGAEFAAMGATIGGPFGAIAGGALGLGAGLIGSIGAKNKEDILQQKMNEAEVQNGNNSGLKSLMADPTSLNGSKYSQSFAFGGAMGPGEKKPKIYPRPGENGIPLNSKINLLAPNKGQMADDGTPMIYMTKKGNVISQKNWTDNQASKALWENKEIFANRIDGYAVPWEKNVAQVAGQAFQNTPKAKAGYPDIPAYTAKTKENVDFSGHWKDVDYQVPAVSGATNRATDSTAFVKQYRTDNQIVTGEQKAKIQYDKLKAAGVYKMGGTMDDENAETNPDNEAAEGENLKPMSKESAEVEGPSHDNGGVPLNNGAEVEGGETISKNYVFSKELGFAQQHKPIAKAIGKLEQKRPTAVRKNTLHALQAREQELALKQESVKHLLGL